MFNFAKRRAQFCSKHNHMRCVLCKTYCNTESRSGAANPWEGGLSLGVFEFTMTYLVAVLVTQLKQVQNGTIRQLDAWSVTCYSPRLAPGAYL
jgi:hypothetical protein